MRLFDYWVLFFFVVLFYTLGDLWGLLLLLSTLVGGALGSKLDRK